MTAPTEVGAVINIGRRSNKRYMTAPPHWDQVLVVFNSQICWNGIRGHKKVRAGALWSDYDLELFHSSADSDLFDIKGLETLQRSRTFVKVIKCQNITQKWSCGAHYESHLTLTISIHLLMLICVIQRARGIVYRPYYAVKVVKLQ